jgi:type I restriction enzyme S subunit
MSTRHPMPLGQVATFIRGITFTPSDVVPVGMTGSVACMRTKNVQVELDLSDVWGVGESFVKRADQFLRRGDILVSSANSSNLVGKCCSVPDLPWRATFGGFVTVLRPDPAQVHHAYLFRWFSADSTQATVRSFGQQTTNISNLNIERCLRLPIPIPTLAEQRRISDVLDRAEALRAKRRAAVTQLDTLTQALFLDLFGDPRTNSKRWIVQRLGETVRHGTIVTYGIVQAGEDFPGGVPYIRTGDIVDGQISFDGLRLTDPKIADRYSRSRVEAGDIVMSIRATVGTTALVPQELHGANLTQGTARIAPGPLTERQYLLTYLRTTSTQSWINAHVKGATFREITLGRLRDLPVLIPPIELQEEFARRVEAVEALKCTARASLAQMDALFASLQHRAFQGEL